MIGAVSGYGSYYGYNPYTYAPSRRGQGLGQTAQPGTMGVVSMQRAATPETPIQPVRPSPAIRADESRNVGLDYLSRMINDPVEMAVRMRIQYVDGPAQSAAAAQASGKAAADPAAALQRALGLAGPAPDPAAAENSGPSAAEGAQQALEAGECQTCAKRKYQDGSDDPGVSFKSPTSIHPDQAAAAVRGHEMEHVVRERAKAEREDRKVVSQSVTLHSEICPDCGRAYISGGTTRTTTASDEKQAAQAIPGQREAAQAVPEQQARTPFSAVA